MIAEDLLEEGLRGAADEYAVPPAAVDELLAKLSPPRERVRRRASRRTWVIAAAASVIGLVIVAAAIGAGMSGPGTTSGTSGGAASGEKADSGALPQAIATPRSAPHGPALAAPAGRMPVGAAQQGEAQNAGSQNAGSQNGAQVGAAPNLVPAAAGAKVVKTGEIDLQIGKGQVAHTIDELTAIAVVDHGYVADSHSSEGIDASGAVTMRVPVRWFEKALVDVRDLHGPKVMSQQSSGDDVTAKYVDLQARIHALEATRAAFERILGRATTIGETLDVQSRITSVQTQIEQLQGQVRVIDDQASYATLAVTLAEPAPTAAASTHHSRSGLGHAVSLSVSRFVNGIEAIISIIGPILLVLVIAAVLLLAGRFGYRRLRRQFV